MALLSEYGFNEGSGLVSADSSGNGHDLTALHTTNSWDASGHTGAGGKVKHSGVIGPNVSQSNCTVMCWIKRTGTWANGFAGIIANSGEQFFFECDRNNSYLPNCYGGSSSCAATTALALDTWTHVAATQTSGTGSIQMFINGSASGSPATGNSPHNFGSGTWNIMGEAGDDGEDDAFVGIIDEVRIFDTVLTAGEITTWMNTPVDASDIGIAWIKG